RLPPPPPPTLLPYSTLFRSYTSSTVPLPPVVTRLALSPRCSPRVMITVSPGWITPPPPTTASPFLPPSFRPRPHRTRALRSFERSEEHTSELQSRENLVCRL